MLGDVARGIASFTKRLSSFGPEVDRWDDPDPYGFDGMASLLAETYGSREEAQAERPTYGVDTRNLTLSLPSLKDVSRDLISWRTDQNRADEYNRHTATLAQDAAKQASANLGGGWGNAPRGNFTPSAYGYSGRTGVEGTKGSGPYGLQPAFYSALSAANAGLREAGLGELKIGGGWRSYEGQVAAKKRWTDLGKPQMAATPGNSTHGIGLAADLQISDAQYRWLKANGAKYGLVNLPGETWHWQLSPDAWRSAQQRPVAALPSLGLRG